MDKEFYVNLSSIRRVKDFVKITNEFDCDIDIISGRYVIDGKSIMGIFSLNLLEPLLARICSFDPVQIESFNRVMEEFRI